MHLEFCFLLLLFSASSQTGGQIVALPPATTPSAWLPPTGTSGVSDLMKGPVNDVEHQRQDQGDDTTSVANTEKTILRTSVPMITRSTEITSQPAAGSLFTTAQSGTQAATPHSISPTYAAEGRAAMTKHPVSTFSSQNANTTTAPQSVTSWRKTTTAGPLTSRAGRDPAGPQHLEVQPGLNVGEEGALEASRPVSDPVLSPCNVLSGLEWDCAENVIFPEGTLLKE
ncbi:uncharacterized protein LOC133545151 isoform X2 [Nerophis ophidion]|uniref:uncharacterized protein LOC133545151 isoform X2 n=1 Tax=Nerophis ophidion TaxID=159077 RepID=UPI002AE073AD|nr:uncharacterized protein LOC133545151 isoform X2 [Nerophis ophidion]